MGHSITAEADCINRALASAGIEVLAPAVDEFETVGLHAHRRTDDGLPGEPDEDA